MIAFVRGTIFSLSADSLIVDNHGIGYRIFTPQTHKFRIGSEVTLYTYQQVREDGISLFGFESMEGYEIFLRLISVKGVGAKTALAMLGTCTPERMIEAIENNDVKLLKSLPGIGAKTAQQIVLDLKGKLVEEVQESKTEENQELNDAMDALRALGYRGGELTALAPRAGKAGAGEHRCIYPQGAGHHGKEKRGMINGTNGISGKRTDG